MLKVIKVSKNSANNRLAMTIRGTEAEDFLLAQEIFRALVSYNFCVESEFGYDENLQEILVFKYPKSKDITLLYEAPIGQGNGRYSKFTK
jgi:hypothetical protein